MGTYATKLVSSYIFLTMLYCIIPVISCIAKPIVLSNGKLDYFIENHQAAILEDSSLKLTIDDVATSNQQQFGKPINSWENNPSSSAFWIRIEIVNKCTTNENFKIEFFDYDIDDVSAYFLNDSGKFTKKTTGYQQLFRSRELAHKNISFDLPFQGKDTLVIYLRIYSNRSNSLKPVIRSYDRLLEYSLIEYIWLGIFYGFMLFIVLYNFIYYLILRTNHYLYYLIYVLGIVLYLMSKNGTGFQYIWPNIPEVNKYVDSLSISVGIVFLLLFSNSYLELNKNNKLLQKVIFGSILLKLIILVFQITIHYSSYSKLIDFLFIQIAFAVGVLQYKAGYRTSKWYIIAFILLNSSFLISWLEHIGIIQSNTLTVYSLNIGVTLQFVFLSIALAESVKDTYKEKNKALSELLLVVERNESMRILELKRQMNPHFIFNALNSILQRILTEKKEEAAKFLMDFAKLIRKKLDIADKIFIPLEDEIENLRLYLSIENMRLGNSFQYEIIISENIQIDDIDFPALVLQPFVENAIWHGLMPKDGEKLLKIEISQNEKYLEVIICDNGIGRKQSSLQNKKPHHESKGINIITERLKLIELKYKKECNFSIIDLFDSNNEVAGTKVYFKIEIV